MKTLAISLFLFFSFNGHAQVTTGTTSVSEIFTYADIGPDGDFVFTVEDPIEACDGFWGDSSSVGTSNVLSVLLSAYHAKSPLIIYADETKLFTRSSKKFCRLTTIRLRDN